MEQECETYIENDLGIEKIDFWAAGFAFILLMGLVFFSLWRSTQQWVYHPNIFEKFIFSFTFLFPLLLMLHKVIFRFIDIIKMRRFPSYTLWYLRPLHGRFFKLNFIISAFFFICAAFLMEIHEGDSTVPPEFWDLFNVGQSWGGLVFSILTTLEICGLFIWDQLKSFKF